MKSYDSQIKEVTDSTKEQILSLLINKDKLKNDKQTLSWQSELTNKLPGLISLCMILAECKYFRPTII